jgi:L-ribulose-5-phosphate 3-epimerase
MKNLLGVMQGRLLPKYKNYYQTHPVGKWKDEFDLASNIGLDCIEFIFDHVEFEKNPLFYQNGHIEIKDIVKETGVLIKSICADYFMKFHFHSTDKEIVLQNIIILENLMKVAQKISVSNIIIPLVDSSSIKSNTDLKRFIDTINALENKIDFQSINMCLETDLPPLEFCNLLEKIKIENVAVNYDSGNSASLGYDINEEFAAYGSKITDIHIKDRLRYGKSVLLGSGSVDFNLLIENIKKYNYCGPLIFQAYRDQEGYKIFKKQFEWFKKLFVLE